MRTRMRPFQDEEAVPFTANIAIYLCTVATVVLIQYQPLYKFSLKGLFHSPYSTGIYSEALCQESPERASQSGKFYLNGLKGGCTYMYGTLCGRRLCGALRYVHVGTPHGACDAHARVLTQILSEK
jgi:hypothetical protein